MLMKMNKYKNQNQLLDAKIIALETKRRQNLKDLQLQLDITYQELRPSKLLSRALEDIKEDQKIKGNLFESVISIVGGFISKKIFIGKSNSTFKNLFGYAIQYLTTKIISKNI